MIVNFILTDLVIACLFIAATLAADTAISKSRQKKRRRRR